MEGVAGVADDDDDDVGKKKQKITNVEWKLTSGVQFIHSFSGITYPCLDNELR